MLHSTAISIVAVYTHPVVAPSIVAVYIDGVPVAVYVVDVPEKAIVVVDEEVVVEIVDVANEAVIDVANEAVVVNEAIIEEVAVEDAGRHG